MTVIGHNPAFDKRLGIADNRHLSMALRAATAL